MDCAAPSPYCSRMRQLVERFHDRVAKPGQQHVARGLKVGAGMRGQGLPVHRDHQCTGESNEHPHYEYGRMQQRAQRRLEPVEEPGRIKQRHPKRERIDLLPTPAPDSLSLDAEQAFDVRLGPGVHQSAIGQLGEQPDNVALRQRIVAQVPYRKLPDLVHRTRAVQAADELVGRGIHSIMAAARRVAQHVPGLAAIALPLHLDVRAQFRLQVRDPVPVRVEQRFDHVRGRATTSSDASSPATGASGSRGGCARLRRAWLRLSVRAAAAFRAHQAGPQPRRNCGPPQPWLQA